MTDAVHALSKGVASLFVPVFRRLAPMPIKGLPTA